ncbi:MAG: hypothetical protein IKF19_02415 [Bacilli bacterium]|nr:hypothetical protein [Bacilli bacterium]
METINYENLIILTTKITKDPNYKITNNDLKTIQQSAKLIKQNDKLKSNYKLINYLQDLVEDLSIASQANYYIEETCPNYYLNYLRQISSKKHIAPDKKKKLYMVNIIHNNENKKLKTKLSHDDILNFITDKHNLSNYFNMYPLLEKIKSNNKTNIKKYSNKVKNELDEFILFNIENNHKTISLDEFIEYYNNKYDDDFKIFGYKDKTQLNRRILIEILYKNQYNHLCFSSTGFEKELIKNIFLKEEIIYEENEIDDFIKEQDKKRILYDNLLKKYKKETDELLSLKNISIEYFVYSRISKEDRDLYLDMIENYLYLSKKINNNYTKNGIYSNTAKKIEEKMLIEMLKNPQNMSKLLEKYSELLKKESKYFAGTSKQINSKKVYTQAKKQHIKDNGLQFVKEITNLLASNINSYGEILKNKKFNTDFTNEYFKYFEKLFPEMKEEAKEIKKDFKEEEKEYFINKDLEELDKQTNHIINVSLKFIFDDKMNNFNDIIKSDNILNNYSTDLIYNKIKQIDMNLYHSIIAKKSNLRNILINYLNKSYSSFEYFLKSNNITEKKFNELFTEIKEHDKLLYLKFIEKYKAEKENTYPEVIKNVKMICNKILEGVENQNGEKRQYNFLDYSLDTNLTLEEFVMIFKNKVALKHEEVVKIFTFINNITGRNFTRKYEPKKFTEESIKGFYYTVNNRTITDEEKEAILKYMNAHNFKYYEPLYIQIVKSYLYNDLDLSSYLDNKKVKTKTK